jgi:hypothetical protein
VAGGVQLSQQPLGPGPVSAGEAEEELPIDGHLGLPGLLCPVSDDRVVAPHQDQATTPPAHRAHLQAEPDLALGSSHDSVPTPCITDDGYRRALRSTRNRLRRALHQGALALIDVDERAANWCRQRAARVADQAHKPLKTGASERVPATTICDLLANRWQTALGGPPSMRQAGCWTRPDLVAWGGAPRRNRTGDPILTMNLAPTAVRTGVSAGRRRP